VVFLIIIEKVLVIKLEKKMIIKKNHEITKLMAKKNSVANKYFIVYKQQNKFDHFRYVISIGKKYGNAVERNKIKRQIRSLINSYKDKINKNWDILIIIRPTSSELSFIEIEKNLLHVLDKANIIKSEVK
jgi:ribonuclease P protein component